MLNINNFMYDAEVSILLKRHTFDIIYRHTSQEKPIHLEFRSTAERSY